MKRRMRGLCGLWLIATTAACRPDGAIWVVRLDGKTIEDHERVFIGVGVETRFEVARSSRMPPGHNPSFDEHPKGLELIPDPGVMAIAPSDQSTTSRSTFVDVTASEEGLKDIALMAENTDDVGKIRVHARPIDQAWLRTATPRVFVETPIAIQAGYTVKDPAGLFGFSIPGKPVLEVNSNAGRIVGNTLMTGPAPQTYWVKTSLRPEALAVETFEISAIQSVKLDYRGVPTVNTHFSATVVPVGPHGEVAGEPKERFVVEVEEQDFKVQLGQRVNTVDVTPLRRGLMPVRIRWGPATSEIWISVER